MPVNFNAQYKASSRQQRSSKLQPARATVENLCSSLEMIASKALRDQHDFQYMLLKTENSRTRVEMLNTQGSQEVMTTAQDSNSIGDVGTRTQESQMIVIHSQGGEHQTMSMGSSESKEDFSSVDDGKNEED